MFLVKMSQQRLCKEIVNKFAFRIEQVKVSDADMRLLSVLCPCAHQERKHGGLTVQYMYAICMHTFILTQRCLEVKEIKVKKLHCVPANLHLYFLF